MRATLCSTENISSFRKRAESLWKQFRNLLAAASSEGQGGFPLVSSRQGPTESFEAYVGLRKYLIVYALYYFKDSARWMNGRPGHFVRVVKMSPWGVESEALVQRGSSLAVVWLTEYYTEQSIGERAGLTSQYRLSFDQVLFCFV